MKKQGKAFLLTSGILEIIYSSLLLLGSILIIALTFSAASLIENISEKVLTGFTASIMVGLGLLVLALGIMFLVFGIISVRLASKDIDKYLENKGKILTFGIIETVFLALSILGTINSAGKDTDTISIISSVIVIVVLALIAAFKYTAYSLMLKQSREIKPLG